MKKATALASPDIALVKYWGKKNEQLRLPENGSISLILGALQTTTTVAFDEGLQQDQVTINGEVEEGEASRVKEHLSRVRVMAGIDTHATVVSTNNFPKGTGLSSSGSGFAALTVAAAKAAGLELSQKELSILARQGSGTACRCICGGFVEWKDGDTSDTSYSETIYPASHWDIRDVVVIVDEGKKLVSSTQGHALAHTSIFYAPRLAKIQEKINAVKTAIDERDFTKLGTLVEAECLEFHSILLTSQPSMIAWYPGTIEVMLATQELRREGVEAYFSISTGFNVHILTLPQYEVLVKARMEQLSLVRNTLVSGVGEEPKLITKHLF